MVAPTYSVRGDKISMRVPFSLNGVFRTVFKTAKWDAGSKAFSASHTPQNLKKWDAFLAAVASHIELLADCDRTEMTASEACALAEAAATELKQLKERIASATARGERARQAQLDAKVQIQALMPVLETAKQALEVELSELHSIEAEREVFIAPVLALYEAHGIESILLDMESAANLGYTGKPMLIEARERSIALLDSIWEIGYTVDALWSLSRVSLNRPSKVIECVDACREMYLSGIKVKNVGS
jgi:hypothetical protein